MEGENSLRKFFFTTRNRLWTNNTLVLLVCIFIASVFWFLTSLSKNYISNVNVDVVYVNKPQDKVVINELPKNLVFRLQATGWQLLREYLKIDELTIAIDVDRFSEAGILYSSANLEYFESQLPGGYDLVQVSPAQINFAFDKKATKKVPVILDQKITLDPLYGFSDTVRIQPDSVVIAGPKVVLDSIFSVTTLPLILENIERSRTGTINLKKPSSPVVSYETSEIKYQVTIEPFTETKIELPIRVINAPNEKIMLVTKNVTASFQIPLDQFDVVNTEGFADQFDIVADFEEVDAESNVLRLKVLSSPGYIKKLQLDPRQVNFLFVK